MVSTHLKNTSQIGRFPQVGVKMINIGNHQLVLVYQTTQNHFAEKKQRFLQTNYTLFVNIPANHIPWVVPRPLPSNSDKWRCSSKSPNLKIQRHRGGDYLCSGKPELFPIYTAYLEDHPSVLRGGMSRRSLGDENDHHDGLNHLQVLRWSSQYSPFTPPKISSSNLRMMVWFRWFSSSGGPYSSR